MRFLTAYCTDIGTKRPKNQDSLCIKVAKTYDSEVLMAIVCDGMGGFDKGELASGSVIRAFNNWFEDEFSEHVINNDYSTIEIEWERLIQGLNQKIMMYGESTGIKLGTTITAMLVMPDGNYIIGHVGDTRVYKIDKDVNVLTRDHTLVAREVMQGKLTEEEAKRVARRNILLQCVGASKVVIPDYITGKLNKNETYLLCSDGFVHEISKREIWENFKPDNMKNEEQMKYFAENMVKVNMERGEKDNISVIVIKAE